MTNLLDEIEEDNTEEEFITLEIKEAPLEKITRIFANQQVYYYFEELKQQDLPTCALTYYFTNGQRERINVNEINLYLADNPICTTTNLYTKFIENKPIKEKQNCNINFELKLLQDHLFDNKKLKETKNLQGLNPVLQHVTNNNFIAFLAAQKLLQELPTINDKMDKINNFNDITYLISYVNMLEKLPIELKPEIEGLFGQEYKDLKTLHQNGREKVLGHYFPRLMEIINGKAVTPALIDDVGLELLGKDKPQQRYEQAINLAQIVDPNLVRKIIPIKLVKEELEIERKDYLKNLKDAKDKLQDNFSELLNEIFVQYYKECGYDQDDKYFYKDATLEDMDKEYVKFKIKENVRDYKGYKDKLGQYGGCTCNKTWGRVFKIVYDGLEQQCLTADQLQLVIPKEEAIQKYDKLNIEGYERICTEFGLELGEKETKLFEKIRAKNEDTEYFKILRKMKAIENRLRPIYGNEI